ncbi:MAG: Asp-tRNA(Asn)/Glu-tRNA(Gln) amidotransferase subunit GatB [Bacilli bacterium]
MNFEAVIGLEIHIEMKTKSKMFSSAPIDFNAAPNSLVNAVDMAFPGIMPVVNKQAVINAIRVSNALHMTIDHMIVFDRKNYFYSDLPKGYQITQDKRPIGRDGYLEVKVNDAVKRIGIERLHMEEDTCMQHHLTDCTLLDYNRAGIPLIEIVSRPEIRSGLEAMKYVEKIREIVTYSGVSNGKMEEGSLRCDVNVSLRPVGSETFGTKVEIKNLNSIANIERALDYEVKRQEEILSAGKKVIQETRRYDETEKATIRMRLKTDAVDYKYFTEPNITPIVLSEQFVKTAIDTCPELYDEKVQRFTTNYGLSEYDISVLLLDQGIADYYDQAAKYTKNYKVLANWIIGDVSGYLNREIIKIEEFLISPERLANLVNIINDGKVSNKQGREIFEKMLLSLDSPEKIANDNHMIQISDDSFLLPIVNEVLEANAQSIDDYRNGKDRALGFLVGQVMKKSQGKANPKLASQLVLEELKKRI